MILGQIQQMSIFVEGVRTYLQQSGNSFSIKIKTFTNQHHPLLPGIGYVYIIPNIFA